MPLSHPQNTIANDTSRFRVVIAGRRFGKTHLSLRELAWHARIPDKEVWYVAPTYRQARNIVWRKLKNKLQDLNWVKKTNESDLSILLKNGSTISLKGADNYDSLRGVGLDFIVCDEFADIDPEAWYETLRPTLSDRLGKALFIGTPKGIGNWSYELYQNCVDNSDWTSYQYTTIDGGRVPDSEIEAAQRDLDERTFRQEYLATFETYSGRIYYNFDRVQNLLDPNRIKTLNTQSLYIGMDFNIDPMSAVIAVRENDTLFVLDEVRLFSSNTQEIVDEIRSRYPKNKIFVYPDPSSRQRKTSAGGATDLTILQNNGWIVKAPRSHTPVRDRIVSVNSRLKSANGQVNLYISQSCRYTIESLERQVYKPGSSQPDKDGGYDHMNDALGYLVDYLFPLKRDLDPEQIEPTRWGHSIV